MYKMNPPAKQPTIVNSQNNFIFVSYFGMNWLQCVEKV